MEFKQFEKYTYLQESHKAYLEQLKAFVSTSPYRPKHHIYPPCGLMNDPNGLNWFNGQYHVFYQWFPFEASHGMKHWAHVKSTDLISWEWDEEMLIPDQEYEKNGCYSGNAIQKDDKLYLFYTANYKTDTGRIPKQALAVMDSDGHIVKWEKNPVINGAPEGMSGEIRDPFVFEQDNRYYMLLGAMDQEEKGRLLLYHSENLYDWFYDGPVSIKLPGELGTMYECPGFIRVDGCDVLILSPMGLKKEEDRFRNRFSSLYFTGRLDLEKRSFEAEYWDEIDSGFDFYAPQVFYGKDREPLLIGWFGCGEQKLPTDAWMWCHGLAMPRKLSVKNGRLYQHMLPEIKALYQSREQDAKTYVVKQEWSREDGDQKLVFGEAGNQYTIQSDWQKNQIVVDRTGLSIPVDPEFGLIRKAGFTGDRVRLEIYIDNSFIEVYINDGERVMSFRAF